MQSAEILYGPNRCSIGDLPEGGIWGHNIIVTANEEVLNCGGVTSPYSKSCYVYEKESKTWMHHSNLTQARNLATSITMPNGAYMFGGDYSTTTYEYMAKNDKFWQKGSGSIPDGFWAGCGVRLNNYEVALVGGSGTESRIMKYNTATNTFSTLNAQLRKPRAYNSCFPLGSQILVVGGLTSEGQTLASSEIINMSDGTAGLSAGDLNNKRRAFGLVALAGNSKKILAFGGKNDGGLIVSVEEFDEETRQWQTIDNKLSQKKEAFGYQVVPVSAVCPTN